MIPNLATEPCHVVDERLRFIARLLDGEKMAGLCREFGISRKTGYKIYARYKDCGLEGLTDRSRRPDRHANQDLAGTEAQRTASGAARLRRRARDTTACVSASERGPPRWVQVSLMA